MKKFLWHSIGFITATTLMTTVAIKATKTVSNPNYVVQKEWTLFGKINDFGGPDFRYPLININTNTKVMSLVLGVKSVNLTQKFHLPKNAIADTFSQDLTKLIIHYQENDKVKYLIVYLNGMTVIGSDHLQLIKSNDVKTLFIFKLSGLFWLVDSVEVEVIKIIKYNEFPAAKIINKKIYLLDLRRQIVNPFKAIITMISKKGLISKIII